MSFWDAELGRYVCPCCGWSTIQVGAVEAKTVLIDHSGTILSTHIDSHTEFIGPWECLHCGYEELVKEE
jgi:hypothetical protein